MPFCNLSAILQQRNFKLSIHVAFEVGLWQRVAAGGVAFIIKIFLVQFVSGYFFAFNLVILYFLFLLGHFDLGNQCIGNGPLGGTV